MTLQPLPSGFPYVSGNFFYQCTRMQLFFFIFRLGTLTGLLFHKDAEELFRRKAMYRRFFNLSLVSGYSAPLIMFVC
jgi:hypothetical protein